MGIADEVPELRAHIDFALNVLPDRADTIRHEPNAHARKKRRQAITADQRSVPVALGGSGKLKKTTVTCDDARRETGGHVERVRCTLDEMLDLQGLPRDIFGHSPLTMQGKRKFIGNAVPLPMAVALGAAVSGATR